MDFDLFPLPQRHCACWSKSIVGLVFDNDVLARLFLVDPGTFAIGSISIRPREYFRDLRPYHGYLLTPGVQIGGTQIAGRGAGDDGTFGMGLTSFNGRQFRRSTSC